MHLDIHFVVTTVDHALDITWFEAHDTLVLHLKVMINEESIREKFLYVSFTLVSSGATFVAAIINITDRIKPR